MDYGGCVQGKVQGVNPNPNYIWDMRVRVSDGFHMVSSSRLLDQCVYLLAYFEGMDV